MVQFDNQSRQVKVKIVYYGPALGGKTTSLQHIHKTLDPERRSRLYTLNTASDRTLFFDLLSLNIARIRGFLLTICLYTVPGQVQYNATRRAVLAGTDGVVFVADSQVDQSPANVESLADLRRNLDANGLDPLTTPLVLLYNKRDLRPLLDVDQLNSILNPRRVPAFPSVATAGAGVMEGFASICELTLASVADKLGLGTSTQAVKRLVERVRTVLRPYVPPDEDGENRPEEDPSETVAVVRQQTVTETAQPLSGDLLVEEAVRANLAVTDLSAHLDSVKSQLGREVRVLGAVSELGRRSGSEREPNGVLKLLVQVAVRQLAAQAAVVSLVPSSGAMREVVSHGLLEDPLVRATDEVGESLAAALVNGRKPCLMARRVEGGEDSFQLAVVESAGFGSALAAPLVAQDRVVGLLTCYRRRDRPPFEEDDLRLVEVLAGTAAMGYATSVASRQLEELNRDLETRVELRTREVRQSFDRERQLNQQLADKSRLLERAYDELAELDRLKGEVITRVTHELLTPASSILTAARILDRCQGGPPEKTVRFVGTIRREASKLVEVVQSLLQVSVLTTPEAALEVQEISVSDLVKRAVSPLLELAKEREVRLTVLAASGLGPVTCHPEMLPAALRAIVKNGIEFNHPGGEVKVEVKGTSLDGTSWLQVRVEDTGAGIAEQELPHVFETFWQAGALLTDKPEGVGLGLTIAKRAVERHGGTVAITRTGVTGTEVTVAVPLRSGTNGE